MKKKTIRNGLYGVEDASNNLQTFGPDDARYVVEVSRKGRFYLHADGHRQDIPASETKLHTDFLLNGLWKRFSKNPFKSRFKVVKRLSGLTSGFKVSDLREALDHCDPEATVMLPTAVQGQLVIMKNISHDVNAKEVALS